MAMDLLCFNLSVLAEKADKVYLYNIIGVTGHHGMVTLPTISRVSIPPHTKRDPSILCTITHVGHIITGFYTAAPPKCKI